MPESIFKEAMRVGEKPQTAEGKIREWVSNFARHASSERNKVISEKMVDLDLTVMGYDVHGPSSRDCIHDMSIEIAQDHWIKIQVKGDMTNDRTTAKGNLSTRGTDKSERNNTWYGEVGIHILAVVCLDGIFYYEIPKGRSQASVSVNSNTHIDLQEWVDRRIQNEVL